MPRDFGVARSYAVSGVTFEDADRDGHVDDSEPRLAGRTVTLSPVEDASTVLGRATSDAEGRYRFEGLGPGRYRVTHTVPTGFARTTDDSDAFRVGPDYVRNFGVARE